MRRNDEDLYQAKRMVAGTGIGCLGLISGFIGLIAFGLVLDMFKGEEEPINEEIVRRPPADVKLTRGYDYKTHTYINYPEEDILTDEEIRMLRENYPEYIIKAPGRQIKNRRQITEQEIEDYLDENPDVLDEYRD